MFVLCVMLSGLLVSLFFLFLLMCSYACVCFVCCTCVLCLCGCVCFSVRFIMVDGVVLYGACNVCDLRVVDCVMVYGACLFWCVFFVCLSVVCLSVFVCVVCDLGGDVAWIGICVLCVLCVCVCSCAFFMCFYGSFVMDSEMLYGLFVCLVCVWVLCG